MGLDVHRCGRWGFSFGCCWPWPMFIVIGAACGGVREELQFHLTVTVVGQVQTAQVFNRVLQTNVANLQSIPRLPFFH